MASNDLSRIIRSYIDAVNADNPRLVEPLLADNVKWSSPAGKRTGPEETRKYMERWFTAFPDLKLEQINTILGEDQAAVECKLVGTHQGNFVSDLGQFTPTQKRISVDLINLLTIRNGKISEIRVFYDSAEIMDQLGFQVEKRAA
ncbi:MAG: ester cyclase [Bdellovibrionia bacterium]